MLSSTLSEEIGAAPILLLQNRGLDTPCQAPHLSRWTTGGTRSRIGLSRLSFRSNCTVHEHSGPAALPTSAPPAAGATSEAAKETMLAFTLRRRTQGLSAARHAQQQQRQLAGAGGGRWEAAAADVSGALVGLRRWSKCAPHRSFLLFGDVPFCSSAAASHFSLQSSASTLCCAGCCCSFWNPVTTLSTCPRRCPSCSLSFALS